jgi:antitoxin component of MazEF toxin-antitoxin module
MLAMPKPMLDALELAAEATAGLSIKGGRLIVDPKRRRRYSLDDCWPNASRQHDGPVGIAFGRPAGRSVES